MRLYFVRTGSPQDEILRQGLIATGHQVIEDFDPPVVHGRRAGCVFAVLWDGAEAAGMAKLAYLMGAGVTAHVIQHGLMPRQFAWITLRARVCDSVLNAIVTFMAGRVADAQSGAHT